MADIKTHLREIGVATTVGLLIKKIPFTIDDLYSSSKFYSLSKMVIDNDISSASNILEFEKFTGEYKTIIDNSYKLGKKIFDSQEFNFTKDDTILWLGNDTQKGDPIDLKIGNYSFSLKEESFILKNMGLYSLLNNLTGSNFQRGLHVFSTFALNEYNSWFKYTWDYLVNYINQNTTWVLNRPGKVSRITKNGNAIIFDYNGEQSIIPTSISTNAQFMNCTSSTTREKVFSKWIDGVLKKDPTYLKLKKDCSETAGNQLASKIRNEYKPDNVFTFFQIWPFDYYYAKSTSTETTILHVPSQTNFKNIIMFVDCEYDVPSSQLNIITTFKNTNTNKILQFRNECRFSHGQFNGTPEAKMYIVKNTPLTELYDPIK